MKLELALTLSHSCAVCKQKKYVRPQERLRQETIEKCVHELREGIAPTICVDCGNPYHFIRNRSARRRYITFLAEHTEDDVLYAELQAMARRER